MRGVTAQTACILWSRCPWKREQLGGGYDFTVWLEKTALEMADAVVAVSEVHRSLLVPPSASFLRKLFAFAGPGFLVAVGYMDPGNWATVVQSTITRFSR